MNSDIRRRGDKGKGGSADVSGEGLLQLMTIVHGRSGTPAAEAKPEATEERAPSTTKFDIRVAARPGRRTVRRTRRDAQRFHDRLFQQQRLLDRAYPPALRHFDAVEQALRLAGPLSPENGPLARSSLDWLAEAIARDPLHRLRATLPEGDSRLRAL